MSIKLTDEATARSVASIKRYFAEHLDEEIGDLKARLLLEFILKEIGPSVYNGAISDAQAYLRERVSELDSACAQDEFAFWPRSSTRHAPP